MRLKIGGRAYQQSGVRLTDYLPWMFIGAPGVVIQKDGLLQKTYRYIGPDLDCVDMATAEGHTDELGRAIMRLGTGWTIFFEAQRTDVREYPAVPIDNEAAARFESEREAYFTEPETHYESSYYLTFVYQPPRDISKKASGIIVYGESAELEIAQFVQRTDDIAGILSQLADVAALDDVETLEYLHSTISDTPHPFAPPERMMHIDYSLADSPLEIYSQTLKLGDDYIISLSICDYPSSTFPGILNELNACALDMRYVSRFICLSKADSKKRLESYGRKYFSGRTSMRKFFTSSMMNTEVAREDVGSMAMEQQVNTASVDLANDDVGFGYCTNTIIIKDGDLDTLTDKATLVKQIVQSAGFACKVDGVGCFQAWLGSIPGHVYANFRRPLISTGNLSHIVPLTSIWRGNRHNEHLEKISGIGVPHLVTATESKTPYYLNLNPGDSDVGHTLILGPTGSGKSTLLGTLAIQWLKYPKSRIIIIDKDRSAGNLTSNVQGQYYEPGSGRQVFQPLRRLESESDVIWANEYIDTLLSCQHVTPTPETRSAAAEAVRSLSGMALEQRTLTTFCQTVQDASHVIVDALNPYLVGGPYGSIFDANESSLDFTGNRWIMFELAPLMDMGESVVIPALLYLFREMEIHAFDGSPTLLIIDEAWLFLSHEQFRSEMKNWLKTLRKKHVFVLFATQEIADAANSPIASTIIGQTETKILLPDPSAETAVSRDMYTAIGLDDAEIGVLSRSMKKRHYLIKSVEGTRLFRLDLTKGQLELITQELEKESA